MLIITTTESNKVISPLLSLPVLWCVDAVFRLPGVFHDFLYGDNLPLLLFILLLLLSVAWLQQLLDSYYYYFYYHYFK